jgi:hypothetical protein
MLEAQITLINHAITQPEACLWALEGSGQLYDLQEPCNIKIHRLRVIHLYEADLNLILGVKWWALAWYQ